jgi:hypothetical protein
MSAFVVLAHAQLEQALEDTCRGAIARLYQSAPTAVAQAWNSFLVHVSDEQRLGNVKKRWGQPFPPVGRLLLQFLAKEYEQNIVGGNNGISKKYLIALFSPLGLDLSAHATDVATLTTFAEIRGPVAHTGVGPIQQSSPIAAINEALAAASAADRLAVAAALICSDARIPSIPPLFRELSWWRRILFWLATL